MRASKAIALVIGALAALVALGLVAGGAAALWAHTTQRDDDGFYNASTDRFSTSTYAITSGSIDLGTDQGPGEWNPVDDVGDARVRAERVDGGAVFIGIGPEADVAAYLAGVAHDEVVDVSYRPFEVRYDAQPGAAIPADPAEQAFWVASAAGEGRQSMTWDIESGEWAVVVMNADASAGVDVEADAGIKTGWLLPIGGGLLGAAALVGLVAGVLIAVGARGERTIDARERDLVDVISAPSYPLRLDAALDSSLGRWRWLVKWFLAIPHFLVLAVLWVTALVLTVVAGIAILFRGRYPAGIFEFNRGVLRWTWRVTFYALTFGTDRYPPFTLGSAPGYPARLEIDEPGPLSRGLVLVKWWLLALPHLVVVGLFTGGNTFGGLIAVLVVIAALVLAVTGRYPPSIFDFVMGMHRWSYRVLAYVGLMTDTYPPFRLDQGGADPGAGGGQPVPAGEPAEQEPVRT